MVVEREIDSQISSTSWDLNPKDHQYLNTSQLDGLTSWEIEPQDRLNTSQLDGLTSWDLNPRPSEY